MATVFKFKADGSGYARGLNDMRSKTQKFASSVKGTLAGAFAVTGIIAGLKSMLSEMDRIQKLSTRFGMSAESMQKLGFAAEQTGSSLEIIAKGLAQANRASVDAGNGLKTYQRAFNDLGLSWEQFAKQDQEGQFRMLAQAYRQATDENKAMAAAQTLLGRAGLELIPLLQEGAEGYDKLTSSLKTYTSEQVAAAAKINDATNKTVKEAKATIAQWIGTIIVGFQVLVAGGTQALIELEEAGQRWRNAMKGVFTFNWSRVSSSWDELVNGVKSAGDRVSDAMDGVRDDIDAGVSGGSIGGGASVDTEREAKLDKIKKLEEEITAERERQQNIGASDEEKRLKLVEKRKKLSRELFNIEMGAMDQAEEITNKELEKGNIHKSEAGEFRRAKEAELMAAAQGEILALEKEREKIRTGIMQLDKKIADDAAKSAEEQKEAQEEIAKTIQESVEKVIQKEKELIDALADIEADTAAMQNERAESRMTPEELYDKRVKEREAAERNLATITAKANDDGIIENSEAVEIAKAKRDLQEALAIEDAAKEGLGGNGQSAVIASSLAAIGGGGGTAAFVADPLLGENKKQTSILSDIRTTLQGGDGLDSSGNLKFPEL